MCIQGSALHEAGFDCGLECGGTPCAAHGSSTRATWSPCLRRGHVQHSVSFEQYTKNWSGPVCFLSREILSLRLDDRLQLPSMPMEGCSVRLRTPLRNFTVDCHPTWAKWMGRRMDVTRQFQQDHRPGVCRTAFVFHVCRNVSSGSKWVAWRKSFILHLHKAETSFRTASCRLGAGAHQGGLSLANRSVRDLRHLGMPPRCPDRVLREGAWASWMSSCVPSIDSWHHISVSLSDFEVVPSKLI